MWKAYLSAMLSSVLAGSLAFSQMIALEAPMQSATGGFYEQTGFNWGLSIPGSGNVVGLQPNGQFTSDGRIPFRFGGPTPPVSVSPHSSADATLGLAWRRPGGGGGFFNAGFGQGNNQSISSVSPRLTVTEGHPGWVFDGQVRPFVTGLVPVVGSNNVPPPPMLQSPIRSKLERLQAGEPLPTPSPSSSRSQPSSNAPAPHSPASSAERGALSLREIRAAKAAEKRAIHDPVSKLLARASQAEREGRLFAARQLLRRALREAPPAHQGRIAAKMKRLDDAINSASGNSARKASRSNAFD